MNKLVFCTLIYFTSVLSAAESKNHMVILLDTSASMDESMPRFSQSKMDAAKVALTSVVDKIPIDTKIGFIGFDPIWFCPLYEINRDLLKYNIQQAKITYMSGTPLGTYLKVAADALLEEREKQLGYGTYKILVVTDGDPTNEPIGLLNKYIKDITYRGITVDCIGVSMSRSSVLKTQVHRYMSADDPDSLKQQVENTVLAEIPITDDLKDEFSDIALIPDEIALTIISHLDSNKNYPIGEEPPVVNESFNDFVEEEPLVISKENKEFPYSPLVFLIFLPFLLIFIWIVVK